MIRGWKVVTAISFAAIMLGAVCIGVGILTGAEFDRVFTILDDRYQIVAYFNWLLEVVAALKAQLF